jgi:hypothetical protein
LASVVCCPLTFHILIFFSETPQPDSLKLDRKYLLISKGENGKRYLSFKRGEAFLEINQSETRIVCGGHVC